VAANFEPVAAALLTLVEAMDSVAQASRFRLGLEQLPEVPTCIVAMLGASVQAQHGLPSRWTGIYRVGFINHNHYDLTVSPESAINAWLVELQGDMAAAPTLSGTCEHAWIAGDVEIEPPTRDTPWAECWVSVEVLVLAT
jgi:hypothetical protein